MINSINDLEKPASRLLVMLNKGSIPHALLFAGSEGAGKISIALNLAMNLNCRNPHTNQVNEALTAHVFFNIACRQCTSCKKILSENHPDIITIRPSGKFIKILQIRDLIATLQIKPVEGLKRVVMITEAEKMNPEAANALLKSLEEPPESTMFILTTGQPSNLLPTILSRCQHIGFNPVSSEKIAVYIQNKYKIDSHSAEILSTLCNGSIKKADSFAANEIWIKKRWWIINEFNRLTTASVKDCLIFAEKISEKKEHVAQLLEILMTYVRDLAIYRFNPDKVINQDLTGIISQYSEALSVKSLLSIADLIQNALKDIHSNASLKLTLELMVLKISRV